MIQFQADEGERGAHSCEIFDFSIFDLGRIRIYEKANAHISYQRGLHSSSPTDIRHLRGHERHELHVGAQGQPGHVDHGPGHVV